MTVLRVILFRVVDRKRGLFQRESTIEPNEDPCSFTPGDLKGQYKNKRKKYITQLTRNTTITEWSL